MHFDPYSTLRFVQLERARAARHPQVPMMAPGTSRQLALAPDDETASAALVEGLPRGEVELQFEHGDLAS
jgi:hypothetical protein